MRLVHPIQKKNFCVIQGCYIRLNCIKNLDHYTELTNRIN